VKNAIPWAGSNFFAPDPQFVGHGSSDADGSEKDIDTNAYQYNK
jgi:hypothetical protein